MSEQIVNFNFMRGSQFNHQFTLTDTAPDGTVTATDLTGATSTWQLWDGPIEDPDSVELLEKTHLVPTTEIDHGVDPTLGILLLRFITADTETLDDETTHYHELITHLADGRIRRVVCPQSQLVISDRFISTLP